MISSSQGPTNHTCSHLSFQASHQFPWTQSPTPKSQRTPTERFHSHHQNHPPPPSLTIATSPDCTCTGCDWLAAAQSGKAQGWLASAHRQIKCEVRAWRSAVVGLAYRFLLTPRLGWRLKRVACVSDEPHAKQTLRLRCGSAFVSSLGVLRGAGLSGLLCRAELHVWLLLWPNAVLAAECLGMEMGVGLPGLVPQVRNLQLEWDWRAAWERLRSCRSLN